MDTLTQLQQNRRIIHDLTVSTLARIDSSFSRLAYLASLRDISTNVYEHAGLSAVYPQPAVQQALEQCHQEIFERILETPLVAQEVECSRDSGDSGERAVAGAGSRVTIPTTRPTISASSGVFQDSGMHRDSG